MRRRIGALLLCLALLAAALGGCGASGQKQAEPEQQEVEAQKMASAQSAEEPLTVYLWDSSLIGAFSAYVKAQCPDVDVEFIPGNNNVFLYDYLEKHGELPDIITTRRFSAADAQSLCSDLLDFSAYDVVSQFYPFALQYYMEEAGSIHWLPVCGIPETMIVNKTLLDECGIAIPESYAEFAAACAGLMERGIKPFVRDWAADYSDHSLLQGAALTQFTSLEGMQWRMQAESGSEISFDDALWTSIFGEVSSFIGDAGLGAEDAQLEWGDSYDAFISRRAAIACGTPNNMAGFKSAMADELVRLPYFSQTSDESWIYTYPSLNIAMNRSVAAGEEKLAAAMRVLNCFLSAEGQRIIAGGEGMISYNVNVPSDESGMEGLEEEIQRNAFYIRYASNASFAASQNSVQGLMTGGMNVQQAQEAFESALTAPAGEEEIVAEFENSYRLALNEKGGRDAASSVLTTVRRSYGADLAFTPYYYYTASLHAGGHSRKEISMMVKNGNTHAHLAMAELTGREVRTLVEEYLKDTGVGFQPMNRYELPIASGMKLRLGESENGYVLKKIEVDGAAIGDDVVYSVLLSTEFNSLFARVFPEREAPEKIGTNLASAWTTLMGESAQLEAPEDYIEIAEEYV